ncbi:MAG TPA: thioredoxin domain-containing protein [Anaeromyxobacteraceae bacterium]|nr:thioredoxin domain-containing protein [Anaeromyxobacteraceae bacterium]
MSSNLLFTALAGVAALACTSPSTAPAKAPEAVQAPDPNAPAAKIGGEVVTNKELDEYAKTELKKLDQQYQEQLYQLRRASLDALIAKRLVEAKAKAAGKSLDDYVRAEVIDKIADPTAAEVKALYDSAKAQGRDLPPLDQVKESIVRYLKQQKASQALQAYYEKLKADAKVEILLAAYHPPRQTVEAKGPARGPDKAPIVIVEFSDFECPYCGRAEQTVAEVFRAYPDKVRLVYRDFPLPMHPNAPKAAEAAHCAGDQGKYWEMHSKLFANQRALEAPELKAYAKELKLDQAKFDKCLDSGEKAKLVEENHKAGSDLGVTGTPAFFVNGMLVNGAQPFEAFKELIDAELAQK